MYSFIIKKNKDQINNLLVILLEEISNFYVSRNIKLFFISIPGYLSKSKSICDKFVNKFPFNNGYILKPLNETTINVGTKKYTNQSYLNEKFGNNELFFKELEDHSKVIALIEFYKNNLSLNENLKKCNFNVHCLVIGSSNLSYNTYFSNPIPKGECDIVFLDDEYIKTNADLNLNKKSISEEMVDIYNNVMEQDQTIIKKGYFILNEQIAANKSLKEAFMEIFRLQ